MAELEPWMAAHGIFLDSSGIPTLPDGTPALGIHRPQEERPQPQNTILQQMEQQVAAFEHDRAVEAGELPRETQMVGGFEFPMDPVGYGFGPFYGASSLDYQDSGRGPALDPPQWNMGMGPEQQAPGALNFGEDQGVLPMNWKDYYTPRDFSTGGGFFFADDLFAPGKTPYQFGGDSLHGGGLSTNNYRLLPGDFRTPRYIMRNGLIIDRLDPFIRGPGVRANQSAGPNWALGNQAALYPAAYAYGNANAHAFAGWPGSIGSWATVGSI